MLTAYNDQVNLFDWLRLTNGCLAVNAVTKVLRNSHIDLTIRRAVDSLVIL